MILALTFLGVASNGQINPNRIPDRVDNVKTDKHIKIQARLFIIPPDGFELSNLGISKNENTMIVAFDQVYGDYFASTKNFNKEGFQKKGAKVFEYKEFTFGDYSAKYISMETDPKETKSIMVFGDKTFSVMITGMFPSSDSKTGEQIKKAILSIYFKKELE